MSKKEKDTNPIPTQNLVIFKAEKNNKSKTIDKYSFETVDQEDKIILVVNAKPFGGHYRYSIIIDNQSLAPVSEVKIKVTFPDFLMLTRCYPPTISVPDSISKEGIKQINIKFDELNETSKKQIHLHFTPISLNIRGEIQTVVTYVNVKDFVRALNSGPEEIFVDKIAIIPKILPTNYIKRFCNIAGNKKAIRSLGIGIKKKINKDMLFDILEKIFITHNFQLITKDVNKKILWVFGREVNFKEDILAIGQIVSNKIEIIASSQNQHILISFLTMVSNDFKERILADGIIKSKKDVFDLECKYCGAVLPYFPKKGKSVECKNCNYEQIIW